METSVIENLDLACATVSKSIAEHPSKGLKNLITDALSVLEEQGVYVLFLFLCDREKKKKEKNNAQTITKYLKHLMESTPSQKPLLTSVPRASVDPQKEDCESLLSAIREELAPDIEKLLLAQSLLRQTLVYARYHAQPDEKENAS